MSGGFLSSLYDLSYGHWREPFPLYNDDTEQWDSHSVFVFGGQSILDTQRVFPYSPFLVT
jgi:hypothetical protein